MSVGQTITRKGKSYTLRVELKDSFVAISDIGFDIITVPKYEKGETNVVYLSSSLKHHNRSC